MAQINAYLGFNGACREAMNFYKDCLGGELTFTTVGESPMAGQCPEAMHGDILHSALTNGGLILMGTDMVAPGGYIKGNNFGLALSCDSEKDINALFSCLSAGGSVIDPLKTQFWGAIFGCVEDKYGNRWMLNYDIKR